jgi:hypothetical protein
MIREMVNADIPRLRELHRKQGFGYEFPDLTESQFIERWVVTDENDNPVQAVVARKTVELFFLGDPGHETPRWRFEKFRLLHEHVRLRLVAIGIKDAHCWIPPEIEKSFGRRLRMGFGWLRNEWLCLSRTTERKG